MSKSRLKRAQFFMAVIHAFYSLLAPPCTHVLGVSTTKFPALFIPWKKSWDSYARRLAKKQIAKRRPSQEPVSLEGTDAQMTLPAMITRRKRRRLNKTMYPYTSVFAPTNYPLIT